MLVKDCLVILWTKNVALFVLFCVCAKLHFTALSLLFGILVLVDSAYIHIFLTKPVNKKIR